MQKDVSVIFPSLFCAVALRAGAALRQVLLCKHYSRSPTDLSFGLLRRLQTAFQRHSSGIRAIFSIKKGMYRNK